MTNPRAQLNIKINTKVSHKNNGGTTQTAGSITTPDLRVHLGRLKEVSTVASKIYALLGEQIALVSSTIPIKRGHETVQYRASLLIARVADRVFFLFR